MIRTIIILIIDLVSPSYCVCCRRSISFLDNGICFECINDITYLSHHCGTCSGIIKNGLCTICGDRKFYLKKNLTISEFTGNIKKIIYKLKFGGYKRLYMPIGNMMIDAVDWQESIDIITAVPMKKKKKWHRGYDHTELIAQFLAKKTGVPFIKTLKEEKKSLVQKSLSYQERFLNVIGRFSVIKKPEISLKRIMIVDDVFTTGATLNECARILLGAGAAEVSSITVARVNLFN